jgi:replicative DNA helicase
MRPADLLADFEHRGFRFFVRDDRLLVAPSDRLTAEQRDAIRTMRSQLVGLVKGRALSFSTPPPRCPVCGYVAFYQSLHGGTWGCCRCFRGAARLAAVIHISPTEAIPGDGTARNVTTTDLIAGKNRNGPPATIPIAFEHNTSRVREVLPDEEDRR